MDGAKFKHQLRKGERRILGGKYGTKGETALAGRGVNLHCCRHT